MGYPSHDHKYPSASLSRVSICGLQQEYPSRVFDKGYSSEGFLHWVSSGVFLQWVSVMSTVYIRGYSSGISIMDICQGYSSEVSISCICLGKMSGVSTRSIQQGYLSRCFPQGYPSGVCRGVPCRGICYAWVYSMSGLIHQRVSSIKRYPSGVSMRGINERYPSGVSVMGYPSGVSVAGIYQEYP